MTTDIHMRRLSGALIGKIADRVLVARAEPDAVFAAIEQVLTERRGRKVSLRPFPFPPGMPSCLWIDRDHDDMIAFHERTDFQHQLGRTHHFVPTREKVSA